MTRQLKVRDDSVDVFKALADPIRLDIMRQIASAGELACSLLEDTLPISKPTISYHTKILQQAGLIKTRRVSRNSFYVLRPDALREAIDSLGDLIPSLRSAAGTATSTGSTRRPAGNLDRDLDAHAEVVGLRPTW